KKLFGTRTRLSMTIIIPYNVYHTERSTIIQLYTIQAKPIHKLDGNNIRHRKPRHKPSRKIWTWLQIRNTRKRNLSDNNT
ncbi:hypothetical protein LOAG_19103, partial [Loa loa]